jgi:asparagine synthase (glutamine-hydrolysing)
MELSNFSKKISKEEWDHHIDYLDELPDIISTKEKTYLSLKEHISKNVEGKNFGVLLSGGIDSSLIAKICKDYGYNFRCFCVGIVGSKDIYYAQKISDELNLDLVTREYSYEEVENLLKEVIEILPKPIIEDDNYIEYIVKVTVSAVLLGAMRLGNEELFLSGIGAEELFAGYHRHSKAIDEGGEWRGLAIEDLEKESLNGLKRMHNLVFERDGLICNYLSKSVLAPYLANDVILQAMNMDSSQKIDSYNNKKILREIASDLDIPEEFYNRKKKGAQYGSGFDKAISKLAKLNNFKLKKRYLDTLLLVKK